MKRITAVLAVVVALVVTKAAAAATGTSTAQSIMGTININAAGGSNIAVSTAPEIYTPGLDQQQQAWDQAMTYAGQTWPSVDVYTIACWEVVTTAPNGVVITKLGLGVEKCAAIDSGPAVSLQDTLAQRATTVIGTGSPQCSWFWAYDVTLGMCGSEPGTTYEPGAYGPSGPDMIPNLDPYVGQALNFTTYTNWCSYLAPPGFDIAHNNGYSSSPIAPDQAPIIMGCANQQYSVGISLASASPAIRTLAAEGNPLQKTVRVRIGASKYDCTVPKVKGLKLKWAKRALLSRHCRAGVRYAKGTAIGRVKRQGLKPGTPRPRGYRVTIWVVK